MGNILREVNQMKSWGDIGFEIEITKDNSPTLRLLHSVDPEKPYGESMHHSGGASLETTYMYGNPIARVLRNVKGPHFMVVGLGLGYIEMNIAREALKLGRPVGLITSYESIPELREFFWSWLHDRRDKIHPEVLNVYDEALKHVLIGEVITPTEIKAFLKQHFNSVDDIEGSLEQDVVLKSRYHGFLYDAYSSKTTPHLWDEDFLKRFFFEGAAEQSLLSTYACKGSMKRALRGNGFEVIDRPGLFGKRNSTLATKNIP
ncbi:MAG: MnmC family methyltransferase [Bacillota bacterium]